jgi:hypothetical protein
LNVWQKSSNHQPSKELQMNHPSSRLRLPPDFQQQSKGSQMRRIFAGLAVALFMMLGVSGMARAQSYTCDEGSNPPSGTITGDAVITQSGSCTLSSGVSATGSISISADGAIDVGSSLSAGSGLTISGGSSVTTQDISANGNVSITGAAIEIDGDLNNGGSDGSGPVTINGSSTVDTQGITAGGNVQITGGDAINIDGVLNNSGSGDGQSLGDRYWVRWKHQYYNCQSAYQSCEWVIGSRYGHFW